MEHRQPNQGSFSKIIPQLAESLSQFIVPIFSRVGGNGIQIGTAFLVNHADESFLITAAHVLDELKNSDRKLSIYRDSKTFADMDGTAFKTRVSNHHNKADLDVGVILLRGACVPPFEGVRKKAMPSKMIAADGRQASGPYLIAGFPVSKSKIDYGRDVHRSGYWPVVIASEAESAAYSGKGLSRETHLVMAWQKKNVTDLQGRRINPNSFRGMSGCPVFNLLWDFDREALRGVEVVGVLIEYRKSPNIIVATKSFVVHDGIKILLSGCGT